MSAALYYIAMVYCFAQALLSALQLSVVVIEGEVVGVVGHVYLWVTPLIFTGFGLLFLRKYHQGVAADVAFDKPAVVSVIGIISFIVGLTWTVSELRWIRDVGLLPGSVDLATFERIAPPLVLLICGIFFGFIYPHRRPLRPR